MNVALNNDDIKNSIVESSVSSSSLTSSSDLKKTNNIQRHKRRKKDHHKSVQQHNPKEHPLSPNQERVFGTLLKTFTEQLHESIAMIQQECDQMRKTQEKDKNTTNKRKRSGITSSSSSSSALSSASSNHTRILVKQYLSKTDLHTRPMIRRMLEGCLQQEAKTDFHIDSSALEVLRKSSYRYLNRILNGACDQVEQSRRVTVYPADIHHFIDLENRQTVAFQQEERELQTALL